MQMTSVISRMAGATWSLVVLGFFTSAPAGDEWGTTHQIPLDVITSRSYDGIFHDFDTDFFRKAMTGQEVLGGPGLATDPWFDGDLHGLRSIILSFECQFNDPRVAYLVDGTPAEPSQWDNAATVEVALILKDALSRYAIRCPLSPEESGTFSVVVDLNQ